MDTFTITVKPAPSWAGRVVELGPIDQIAPRCYMTTFFCLRMSFDAQVVDIADRLQRALFLTVQEIPQLATTVIACNNSREELKLQYIESTGAYLVFKDYTAAQNKEQWPHGTFDDLAKDHFPYNKLERQKLMDGPNGIDERDGLPSLMVQANLISGGLILVTALHHTVCDGMGHYLFNLTFAKHCRDTPSLEINTLPIDFADRTTIITPDSHGSLKDLPDWKLVSQGEAFLHPTNYNLDELPRLHCAIYFISESRIDQLRAASARAGGQRPSAMVAISAMLWHHVVRARDIDLGRYPEAKLSLTVNARSRMADPCISPFFWGNMSEPNAVARMATSNFSSDPAHFLPAAAQSIQTAVTAVNAPAVRRLVQVLSQLPKTTDLTWNVNRWPGPDMLIVCLLLTPYNHLDFGPSFGGCSEACRVQIGDIEGKPDGRCIMLPPRREDGRGVEVMLQYETRTLERLEADREWTAWFERRN